MRRVRPCPTTSHLLLLVATAAGLFAGFTGGAGGADLAITALDLSRVTQGFGEPMVDKSIDGHPLTIHGTAYAHGLGTHAEMRLPIDLKSSATRFTATVGIDDETNGQGSVEFQVVGDGKRLWSSGLMHGKDAAKTIDLPLTGVSRLLLVVNDAGDGISWDHADWAEARIAYQGGAPEALMVHEPKIVLTPAVSPKPRINGAAVVGVRPGSPYLSIIAATGERPLRYQATGLPAGLSLDAATGIISGMLGERGTHTVTVTVSNALGSASRALRIVVGDRLALTPPMGWNSWNCFANAVTEDKVREAAEALVKAGLRDHGWTYVNIDDFWMPKNTDGDATLHGPERDADGRINANPRFPDMAKLTEHIHSLGLKAGIYSSPGPTTCGGCVSSYQHERQDAERWAAWGFDYLKYDWCSYGEVEKGEGLDYLKKPYLLMSSMLRAQKRDILFSLCQYGMGEVWHWGDAVGGNCWRTTGDITDSWGSMSAIGFNQAGHEIDAGPGHWNDPDMLVVGWVGWGPSLHPTKLTPNEQYTHISLWSLLAAPLLIGCDLTKLDDFTLGLLTNDEVIAVNQDPAGFQARRILKLNDAEVWAKTLEDGSRAVGLFNLAEEEQPVHIPWHALELAGPQQVRDLWRQQDLGTMADGFQAVVARHGCVLLRVARPSAP